MDNTDPDKTNQTLREMGQSCCGPRSRAVYQMMDMLADSMGDAIKADIKYGDKRVCPPGLCRRVRSQLISTMESISSIVLHGIYSPGHNAKPFKTLQDTRNLITQAGLMYTMSVSVKNLRKEIKKNAHRLARLVDAGIIDTIYSQDGDGPRYEEEYKKRVKSKILIEKKKSEKRKRLNGKKT